MTDEATQAHAVVAKPPHAAPWWKGRRAMFALAVVGVVVAALVAYLLLTGDDEPPIRVRNGSLHVELEPGHEWLPDGTTWHPSRGRFKGAWDVKILGLPAACDTQTARGTSVEVTYSDGGTVVFGHGHKTQVGHDPYLGKASAQELRHGVPGDGGYVTAIVVRAGAAQKMACAFTEASQLEGAIICPPRHVLCR